MAQTYDPYGNPYASVGSGGSGAGFTGEFTDANGLVYLRARYYNPMQGQFFQLDPSRQEANLYGYGLGNPNHNIDPSGYCASIYTGISTYMANFWWMSGFRAIGAMWEECKTNIHNARLILSDPSPNKPHSSYFPSAEFEAVYWATVGPTWIDYLSSLVNDITAPSRIRAGGIDYACNDPLNFALDLLSTLDTAITIGTFGASSVTGLSPGDVGERLLRGQADDIDDIIRVGRQAPDPAKRVLDPVAETYQHAYHYRMDPSTIRFTQNSISPTFSKEGQMVEGLIDDLRLGRITPDEISPIRVVRYDGKWWSLDNRRLYAFQQAGVHDIPIVYLDITYNRPWLDFVRKFNTMTDGQSIVVVEGQ